MEKASRGVSIWRGRGREGGLVLLVLASERAIWKREDCGEIREGGEREEKSEERTEREKERQVSSVKEGMNANGEEGRRESLDKSALP